MRSSEREAFFAGGFAGFAASLPLELVPCGTSDRCVPRGVVEATVPLGFFDGRDSSAAKPTSCTIESTVDRGVRAELMMRLGTEDDLDLAASGQLAQEF